MSALRVATLESRTSDSDIGPTDLVRVVNEINNFRNNSVAPLLYLVGYTCLEIFDALAHPNQIR